MPQPRPTSQRAGLERTVATLRKRLANAATLFCDGALDRAGYDAVRTQATTDLASAEAELARLGAATPTTRLPDLDQVLVTVGGWAEALQAADVAAQREVLAVLVERVGWVRQGRGKVSPVVTWTPLGQALSGLRDQGAAQ